MSFFRLVAFSLTTSAVAAAGCDSQNPQSDISTELADTNLSGCGVKPEYALYAADGECWITLREKLPNCLLSKESLQKIGDHLADASTLVHLVRDQVLTKQAMGGLAAQIAHGDGFTVDDHHLNITRFFSGRALVLSDGTRVYYRAPERVAVFYDGSISYRRKVECAPGASTPTEAQIQAAEASLGPLVSWFYTTIPTLNLCAK